MNIRDRQIIVKIRGEVDVILSLVEGFSEETFCKDERTKRAVCMTLINIGELVKNLTEEFKAEHPTLPWRSMTGMRDITAHKYQTLKMGDVWATVVQEIPAIKGELMKISV